jgi:hypothetical protein
MMESRLERCDCHNEVTQALTIRQLSEQENQQVVPASKTLDIFITFILLDQPLEVVYGEEVA